MVGLALLEPLIGTIVQPNGNSKIIDFDGNQGWLHKILIKGDRFAITNQNYISPLQIKNKPQGRVIGTIGKNNISLYEYTGILFYLFKRRIRI